MTPVLVRHTAVARAWAGRCYGGADVGLGREGLAAARALAPKLAAEHAPRAVLHSGLRRARFLAERVAASAGAELLQDRRWAERGFGAWEGRTWLAVWRATGRAMDGMLDDPEGFRPGGDGETTAELAARALAAWRDLPRGPCLVVAHGGPIAAVRMALAGRAWRDLPGLIPAPGEAWWPGREPAP